MLSFWIPVIQSVVETQTFHNRLIGVLFGLGIICSILGLMWPRIRRNLVLNQYGIRLVDSLGQMVTSGWAWFFLLMFIGSSAVFFAVNNSTQKFVLTGDSEEYEGSPLRIWWRTARLVMPAPPLIYGFTINAKKVGAEELTLKEGYLISGIDSTKIILLVSTPPGPGIPLAETLPVPSNTFMSFGTLFDNITEQEFFRKWGNFSMIIEYNNLKPLRHEFDRQWVIDQVNLNHPESQPHVSKRQS